MWGDHCGQANTGVGAKKLCRSGNCWNTSNSEGQLIPGICVDMCNSHAECKATVTIYQQQYKSYCRSVFFGENSSGDLRDRIYLPVCWVAATTESLDNCQATLSCKSSTEACVPTPITRGPDQPGKVAYLCRSTQNSATQGNPNPPQPTKTVGQTCQVESNFVQCKTLYCLPDTKAGQGYCSKPCKSNADCGSGDGMFCDAAYQWIPRRDVGNSVIVPMCRKKKSCIPCSGDWGCAGGYKCTNIGGSGTLAKMVCAPPCTADSSCTGKDGGAKCVAAQGEQLQALNHKVCKPSCF